MKGRKVILNRHLHARKQHQSWIAQPRNLLIVHKLPACIWAPGGEGGSWGVEGLTLSPFRKLCFIPRLFKIKPLV